MEGVRCISSAMVQAATHKAENQRMESTPWDLHLLLVGPIQKGLLFPIPKPSREKKTDQNTFIHHLKTSLSHTLDYFPPLAADGVTISDIVKPVYVPSIVHPFFPLNGMKNCEGIFKPLRGVQPQQKIDPNEETSYYLGIGARPRLHKLPEQYFGNAVKNGTITMKVKELQEQRVGDIAREMNRMIATQTEEEFKNSPRFNVYGNDFGWGRPIAVRNGSTNKLEGKLTLFCGSEEGSIDIVACLLPETLDAMANDQEFMDMVTI
ncbi:hypothetical protein CRYUN_Cryun15aG0119700 [Craigia yunnanensis]